MHVDRARRAQCQAAGTPTGIADRHGAAAVGRAIDHDEAGPAAARGSLDGDIGSTVECGIDLRVANTRTRSGIEQAAGQSTAGAVNDRDIGGVKQPLTIAAFGGRSIDPGPRNIERDLARRFHEPAIAALLTPAGRDTAISPGRIVGPDDHLAAVPVDRGIGLDRCLRTEVSDAGVLDVGVSALVVAPDSNRATALCARGVDHGLVHDGDAVAQHIDGATGCARRFNSPGPFNVGVSRGLQDHLAAVEAGRGRLDHAAVLERAGKDADRIALQFAQVQRSIGRRLHLQADAFQATPRQFDLAPGGQHRAAVRGLDQRVLAGVDAAAQQHHIAAARKHTALHRDSGRRRRAVAEAQASGQGIGVAHAQRRCGKARRVDDGPGAHGDARLVHEHQVAIAAQRAEQQRRGVGDDPVDRRAGRVGLLEESRAARGDGKTLPVDRRVVASGAVLGRHRELVALVEERGLADDGDRAAGIGQGRRSTPGHRDAERDCEPAQHRRARCVETNPSAAARPAAACATRADLRDGDHDAQGRVPDGAKNMVQRSTTRHDATPECGRTPIRPETFF